jgi:hypothetical protein
MQSATQLWKTSWIPAKPVWIGIDVEPRFEKPLIVTVALAEHPVGAH